jgi:hypothetical protein
MTRISMTTRTYLHPELVLLGVRVSDSRTFYDNSA